MKIIKLTNKSTKIALFSSPEVWAAAGEDDPVDFKLDIIDSDHSVAQLSLQEELTKDPVTDAAHCPNATWEIWAAYKKGFYDLYL